MAVNKVEDFRVQIASRGTDFICQTPLPANSASIFFLGPFKGKTILWNMTLANLAHFQANDSRHIPATEVGTITRPFIEIKDGIEGVFQLQVGLDLPIIDEQVIKKTIIMIRNYKRLGLGKIEFGSMHT